MERVKDKPKEEKKTVKPVILSELEKERKAADLARLQEVKKRREMAKKERDEEL